MSITAYVGLPGSGKSYSAVAYVILPALEAGRPVCTNIPLNHSEIRKKYPDAVIHELDISEFVFEASPRKTLQEACPPGAVVVLDELWRLWPSGMKTNIVPEDNKSFLAEHRHRVGEDGFSTEIAFITQDCGQLAAFARQLIEHTYIMQKPTALGIRSGCNVAQYFGCVTGQRGPKTQFVQQSFLKYKKEVFSLYKSHTQSKSNAAGIEMSTDKRSTIWKSPKIIMSGLALLLLPVSCGMVKNIFSGDEAAPVVEVQDFRSAPGVFSPVITEDAPASPPPEPVPTPEPSADSVVTFKPAARENDEQAKYRLAGYAGDLTQGRGVAFIELRSGRQVRIPLSHCVSTDLGPSCNYKGHVVNHDTGPWPPKQDGPRTLADTLIPGSDASAG
nr:hypothetical protein [Oceanococcus sp. HetDA_MAG_MS8]